MLHEQPLSDTASFEALRAERQAQYGVSIAYIKERVGDGAEYVNEVARATISPQGGFYQLAEMPEEFAGALGAGVSHRMLTQPEALRLLSRLEELVRVVAQGSVYPRRLSLYVLYAGGSLRAGRELFVLDARRGEPIFAHGALRLDTVPRFFKVCLDTSEGDPLPGDFGLPTSGVQFFLAPTHTDNGSCLLATLTRAPGAADLSLRPASPAVN